MIVHYKVTDVSYLLKDLLDLDQEQSFGAWFSSLLLLSCGVLLLVTASNGAPSAPRGRQPFRFHWVVLGFGFVLLSLDEVVGLHETLNTVVDYSWTIPGATLALLVGIAFLPFLARLPSRTRWFFILAGLVYLGGALGIERASETLAYADLLDTLEYNLATALEEVMEMSGAAIMLLAVIDYVAGPARNEVELQVNLA